MKFPLILAAFAMTAVIAAPPLLAQQGPPPVTVAKPVVKEIVEDDEFVGRFEASAEVEIRSRVSGYLEKCISGMAPWSRMATFCSPSTSVSFS